MGIFSDLEGTLKSIFSMGKIPSQVSIQNDSGIIKIKNSSDSSFFPIAGIDDTSTSSSKTWSSQKVYDSLNVSSLTDVNLTDLQVNQLLIYDGTSWVNQQSSGVNASSGITLFPSETDSDVTNYKNLSNIPTNDSYIDKSVVCNNNKVLIASYITSSSGLGGTKIDAGIWDFNVWAYQSFVIGNATLIFDVYKRAVSGTETLLFTVSTPNLSSNLQKYTIEYPQQSFNINASDRIVVKISGNSTNIINTTVHFINGDNIHYCNIKTPLLVRHNDLDGLQGGQVDQYYHLTSNQLTILQNTSGVNSGDQTITLTGDVSGSGTGTFNTTINKGNLTESTSSVLTITGGSNSVIGNGTTIQVKQASSSQSGYLSSTDWNTFNSKQSVLGYTPLNPSNNLSDVSSKVNSLNNLLPSQSGHAGKFLTTDGSGNIDWGNGPATWGNISGNLSDQTDLSTALSGKEPTLTKGNLTESTSSVLTITGGSNSVIGNGTTIQVKQASSSQSGYLSSTDWNTFNSKEPTLTKGNLTESTSSVLLITGGTSAIIGSGVGIQVKQASSSQSGYLSSNDWNTFNSKQSSLGYTPLNPSNNLSDVSSPSISLNNLLPNQTNNSSKVLTTNGVSSYWSNPSVAWGNITGNLSDQTDLNTALSGKEPTLTKGNLTESTSSVLTITGGTSAIIGSGVSIQVKQASSSQSGYLSSTDWTTFNSKEPTLTKGNLTESTSSVLTITGGSNSVIGSGTTIEVKQASGSQSGYLSSTDWTNFNSKQSALNISSLTESTSSVLLITGGSNSVIGNGTTIQVKQANTSQGGYLSSNDWNTFNGKLGTSLASANIFVGNSSNIATGVSMSGDASISNTGVLTIGNGVVSLSKMANLPASSIIGNNTGSGSTPVALTPTQVKSLLSISQSDVSGLTTSSSPTFAGLTIGSLSGVIKASSGVLSASATLNDLASPTSDFSMNTHKITNVLNPTNAQDVATKDYVDTLVGTPAIETYVLAKNTSTQTVGGGVYTKVTFPTEVTDVKGEFSSSTFTSTTSQRVQVSSRISMTSGIGNDRLLYIHIYVNGSSLINTFSMARGSNVCSHISTSLLLNTGDTVEIYAYHTDGSNSRSLDGNQYLTISKI